MAVEHGDSAPHHEQHNQSPVPGTVDIHVNPAIEPAHNGGGHDDGHNTHASEHHNAGSSTISHDALPAREMIEVRHLPLALDTSHALDKAMRGLHADWLSDGPEKRKSILRTAAIPVAAAATSGILSPALYASVDTVGKFMAGPLNGAILSGVGSIAATSYRRMFSKERFSHLFARMAQKDGKRNIFKRIFGGLESKIVKGIMFSENREVKQLLSYANPDGTIDVDRMASSSYQPEYWEKLIVKGFAKKADIDAAHQLGFDYVGKDAQKAARMDVAYQIAKRVFDNKLTAAQKHNFVNFKLNPAVMWEDTKNYVKGGLGVAGASMLKSATLLSVFNTLHTDTFNTLTSTLKTGVDKVVGKVPPAVDSVRAFIDARVGELNASAHHLKDTVNGWWATPPETTKWYSSTPTVGPIHDTFSVAHGASPDAVKWYPATPTPHSIPGGVVDTMSYAPQFNINVDAVKAQFNNLSPQVLKCFSDAFASAK